MKNILVIGDSHSRCFRHANRISNNNFISTHVAGASAQGLTNPKSTFNARNIFLKVLENYKNCDHILCMFGEVDCNSTIWIYKDKYNVSLEDQLSRSVNNYKKFITEDILTFFEPENTTILLPILPTVSDEYINNQRSPKRNNINVKISKRTKITYKFIEQIKIELKDYNLNFCSINNLLSPNKKIIDPSFVYNPTDHHLNKKLARKLWFQVLPPELSNLKP